MVLNVCMIYEDSDDPFDIKVESSQVITCVNPLMNV